MSHGLNLNRFSVLPSFSQLHRGPWRIRMLLSGTGIGRLAQAEDLSTGMRRSR